MKHFYSFAIALLAVILSSAPTTAKGANISINSTNFPDENFRNWLLQRSYGQDGVLTDSEIKGVTVIRAFYYQIKSLKGIEYFTALRELSCEGNELTSLDVSKNTALTTLSCSSNQLTSLDLSKNTALTRLICHENQLPSLDVSKNTALGWLYCDGNELTSLDVSKNTALRWLYCQRNKIKGGNMDDLISSLPQNTTASTYYFVVYDNSKGDECNVCTKSQVAAVKAKGWTPYYYYNEYDLFEYEGSEDESDDNPDTDLSQLDNTVYIDNVEVFAGTETTLSVRMKNTAAIRGFQFDLYLPEGVTAVKSSKGKIQATLNKERLEADDEHTLTCSEQADGSIRFLCSSQYEETFTGNDGEVITLQVAVNEDMAEGDYPLYLKDIKLSENNISNYYEIELVKSTLTVSSYVPGDINGDGKVDVSDYIGVANRILNIPQEGFNEQAADIDGNGKIDVSDYIGVVNIIHTGTPFGTGASRATGSRRR